MKRILLVCLTAVLAFVSSVAWAQERTVAGRITSAEDGSPLPGVNVILKGTTSGTVTDVEGKYSLSVPSSGGTLVFTFIGLVSQEIEIGNRATVDVPMAQDITQLSEVVVTGLNVSKEAKTLPYATQTVSSDRLNMTRANNINDALAGKVAGVQVRGQSGASLGKAATIRIRGAGSLNDKQPLYILDGTPVSPEDINQDDVENVSVLKGPSATAIYGQRGDAGVILMTSKKGKKNPGIGLSLSQNTFLENVYVLPKYQNSYAGGSFSDLQKFTWQAGMPNEWKDLDGKFYHDYTDDASWGPRMTGQEYIPWYAWIPGTKYTGKTAKLVGQPQNVRDFYRTGVNNTTNVAFSQATDDKSLRFSYTNQNIRGIMPNTGLNKNTVAVQSRIDFGKFVTVGANINYVNQVRNGEFDDTYSNQSTGSFNQWFHRDLDIGIMKELAFAKSPEGRLVSWNHFNPNSYLTAGDKFYRGYYWWNPYTYFELIDYQQNRDRLFGDVNLTLHLAKGLSLSAFYRKNQSTTRFENKRPTVLAYSFFTENRPTNQPQFDYYSTGENFQKEDNIEVLAMYTTRLLDDKLSVDVSGGGNVRKEEYTEVEGETQDGLVVPDLFTLGNSKRQPFRFWNYRQRKEVRSIYARGNFGYNDIFFLDWSVRNDWSSSLPANNNSYFYPSVGASFVFSELTQNALPFLSLGKVRGSWAQVGSDLDPYQLALLYSVRTTQWSGNSVAGNTDITGAPNELVDPNIKPAISSAFETGIDLKFLNNRAGISFTYFTEKKTDEIISVPISGVSGYTSKKINAGEIERQSLELQIDGTPVQTGDFSWDISVNFAKNTSKINELAPGIDFVPQRSLDRIGGAPAVVGDEFAVGQLYNVVGQGWGQIRGKGIQKINGQPVLDADGLYVPTDAPVYFGSALPDFTGGVINTLRYKNFTLNMNIDFQKGGKFFSLSDFYGSFSGLLDYTAGTNDLGNPIRDNPADGGGVHVKGVDAEGNAVDHYVGAQDYYHQFGNNDIAEPYIYDLTFVKLRELSVSYQIPVAKIGAINKVVKSASFSLVGRNLWLISTNVDNFDPAEISNSFGESGQLPSVRSYGFNLKVGF